MANTSDYGHVMSDRKLFNQAVYTSLPKALKILDERRKDPELMAKVEKLLNGNIPKILKEQKCGVQFRQIATPNNDTKHFLKLTKDFGLTPFFMEYHDDKFSSNNSFKRSLGQLHIQGPLNKKGEYRIEKITIMDFNKHNGKKLSDVITNKSEKLVDFHKKLFEVCGLQGQAGNFCDMSEWVKSHGVKPHEYYPNFFLLFTCFGILFENYSLGKNENEFTKEVVLPAVDKVIELTGVKPLIVPVEPMDIEDEDYWIYYDERVKSFLKNNSK